MLSNLISLFFSIIEIIVMRIMIHQGVGSS